MATLEVLDLGISEKTAAKILKRGIHADEVRSTIEDVGRLPFWWVEDEEQGRRAYVPIPLQDRPAVAVLYPVAEELGTTWNLGSAYFLDE